MLFFFSVFVLTSECRIEKRKNDRWDRILSDISRHPFIIIYNIVKKNITTTETSNMKREREAQLWFERKVDDSIKFNEMEDRGGYVDLCFRFRNESCVSFTRYFLNVATFSLYFPFCK